MELTLGGNVVKVYRFADDPEMPWFQAKPIVTFLGYSHITNTLEDHVYPEDKSALQVLIASKGLPLGGVFSQNIPLGHNELKAIHINEPALYSESVSRINERQQTIESDWRVSSRTSFDEAMTADHYRGR
jgi:hypothetical protein